MSNGYRKQVEAFVDAFNVDDLDQVMTFFAEDAEYVTYDGRHFVGKVAIRGGFAGQFAGRYGQLRFIRDQLFVVVDARQAAVSWRCEHGLASGKRGRPTSWLLCLLATVMGKAPYWEGVDLFSFRDGKLIGKYTYAQTRLPLFRRSG